MNINAASVILLELKLQVWNLVLIAVSQLLINSRNKIWKSTYIYWTKEGKVETNDYSFIPFEDLHSPNDETPFIIWSDGTKEWYFEGKEHRLIGPAVMFDDCDNEYYLNGICYEFKNWINKHPNLDVYLEANGYITNAQKSHWKLKNL